MAYTSVRRAVQLMDEARASGVEPDIVMHTELVNAICSTGDLSRATQLALCMEQAGMPLTSYVYNTLLNG